MRAEQYYCHNNTAKQQHTTVERVKTCDLRHLKDLKSQRKKVAE